MGFDAIQHIIKRNQELQGSNAAQEEVMALPAGHDTGGWREVENLRKTQSGPYERITSRGGSQRVHPSIDNLSGTILTLEAHETFVADSVYRFLAIHTTTGDLRLFDIDNETVTLINDGSDSNTRYSQTHPIDLILNGRLIYIFDADTRRNTVYNIETTSLTKWIPAGGEVQLPAEPLTNLGLTEDGWPEENVFGFKPDREVYSVLNYTSASDLYYDSVPSDIPRNQFSYSSIALWIWFNPGVDTEHLILSDGETIEQKGFYFVPPGTGIKLSSDQAAGTTATTAEYPDIRFIKTLPDEFQPESFIPPETSGVFDDILATRKARISGIEEIPSGGSCAGEPGVLIQEQGTQEFYPLSAGVNRYIYPITTDTQELENFNGRAEINRDTGSFVDRAGYDGAPDLYRGYNVLHVLEDGSLTLPGQPVLVRAQPTDISACRNIAVRLLFDPAPEGVAERYLISTRWLLNASRVFQPTTESYPNGAWFINDKIDIQRETPYLDYKEDRRLTRPLSELLDMAAGVPLQFAADEVFPQRVYKHENVLFLAGYFLRPQAPEIGRNIKFDDGLTSGTGSNIYVHVQFEYSSGRHSGIVSLGEIAEENLFAARFSIGFYGLNSLILNINIYAQQGASGTEYRLVKKISQSDPEFGGLSYMRRAGTATNWYSDLEIVEPPESDTAEISLLDHIATALPPQQIRVANQAKIADESIIRGLVPINFDSDKSSMRFRVMVQTDNNLQLGYLTERLGQVNGPQFEYNFEVYSQNMGVTNGRGLKMVGRHVFLSSYDGLYAITIGANNQLYPRLILSKERYPDAQQPLREVAVNEKEQEYWFSFLNTSETGKVYVCDTGAITLTATGVGNNESPAVPFRIYYYESARSRPRIITNLHTTLYIAMQDVICETDIFGLLVDRTDSQTTLNTIEGLLITDGIGDTQQQVRLHSLKVIGQEASVLPELDLQASRRSINTGWQDAFNADVSFENRSLEMYGTYWLFQRQAIRPRMRLKIQMNTGGFIQHLHQKFILLRNSGKAGEAQYPYY